MKKYLPVVLLVLLISLVFLPQFLIKVEVNCKSQYGDCPREISEKLDSLKWKSLKEARKGIKSSLKDDPIITGYSVQFKLPSVLEVNILVKKPAFAFQDKTTGKIYTVDVNGNILSEKDDTSLPLVIQEGTRVNLFTLKLMAGVFAMYQIRTGTVDGKSLVVELPGGIVVIFPVEGDSEVLLGSLRLIYARVRNDAEVKYKEIDLRFKNPVLR